MPLLFTNSISLYIKTIILDDSFISLKMFWVWNFIVITYHKKCFWTNFVTFYKKIGVFYNFFVLKCKFDQFFFFFENIDQIFNITKLKNKTYIQWKIKLINSMNYNMLLICIKVELDNISESFIYLGLLVWAYDDESLNGWLSSNLNN